MKKSLLLLFPVFLLAFTSCNKEDDSIDKIIGTYYGTRTGNCTFTIYGQDITFPLDGSGPATISRLSGNRIRLTYDGGDEFDGTVSGNHISFESVTSSETDEMGTFSLTIASSGNISEEITINETYSGSYYIQGTSYPITGSATVVLNKWLECGTVKSATEPKEPSEWTNLYQKIKSAMSLFSDKN